MPAIRRAATPTHDVTLDDEPTRFEANPWHTRNRAHRVERVEVGDDSITGVRVVAPAPQPRPVPQAPPALVPAPVLARPVRSSASELVESLSLPRGLSEDMLPEGAPPSGEDQVRIAIVRVVRELGREYREQRGVVLRTDARAIEVIQRHLLACADEVLAGRTDARTLGVEVARHGALFGEILARRLDGTWIDVSGDQPGQWQMVVPPSARLSPIARVQRFLLQRNREQDLVGFFLDLDAASRRRG